MTMGLLLLPLFIMGLPMLQWFIIVPPMLQWFTMVLPMLQWFIMVPLMLLSWTMVPHMPQMFIMVQLLSQSHLQMKDLMAHPAQANIMCTVTWEVGIRKQATLSTLQMNLTIFSLYLMDLKKLSMLKSLHLFPFI